jgi:hypothetical protein
LIIVVPTETPVTKPPEVIVATPVDDDVHVPPAGVPVSVAVPGKHIAGVPVTVGVVPTVTFRVEVQPLAVYVITVVPFVVPVTTPDVDTVPTAGVDELQVPPVGDPVIDKVEGMHRTVGVDGLIVGSMAVDPKTVTVNPLAVAYTVCAHAAVDVCACVSKSWKGRV